MALTSTPPPEVGFPDDAVLRRRAGAVAVADRVVDTCASAQWAGRGDVPGLDLVVRDESPRPPPSGPGGGVGLQRAANALRKPLQMLGRRLTCPRLGRPAGSIRGRATLLISVGRPAPAVLAVSAVPATLTPRPPVRRRRRRPRWRIPAASTSASSCGLVADEAEAARLVAEGVPRRNVFTLATLLTVIMIPEALRPSTWTPRPDVAPSPRSRPTASSPRSGGLPPPLAPAVAPRVSVDRASPREREVGVTARTDQ